MANCSNGGALALLDQKVIACRRCPRLIAHMEEMGRVKRRSWTEWEYWARPVPSFGPGDARLLIIGLAPGAHGANRTGRVFTGDSSGNFLSRVLHATGFASQPGSVSRQDGLQLWDARITCAVHCAPPGNKPLPAELRECRQWLERELASMPQIQVVVALGRLAFEDYLAVLAKQSQIRSPRQYAFGHDREHHTGPLHPVLISSFHPSQQNTSTGKLTEEMLRAVFERARRLITSGHGEFSVPQHGTPC